MFYLYQNNDRTIVVNLWCQLATNICYQNIQNKNKVKCNTNPIAPCHHDSRPKPISPGRPFVFYIHCSLERSYNAIMLLQLRIVWPIKFRDRTHYVTLAIFVWPIIIRIIRHVIWKCNIFEFFERNLLQ